MPESSVTMRSARGAGGRKSAPSLAGAGTARLLSFVEARRIAAMRVAIIALLAVAAVAGRAPSVSACPFSNAGSNGSTSTIPIPVLGPALEPIAGPLASALGFGPTSTTSTTTTNNPTIDNITNNFITNNAAAQQGTADQGTTAQGAASAAAGGATAAPSSPAFAPSAGGGGIGGGGGGLGGGGFSGGSSISGTPVNPSSDLGIVGVQGFGGGSSPTGGGGLTDSFALASLAGGATEGVGFGMGSPETSAGALTAGVTFGSLPATTGATDDAMTVAMVATKGDDSASADDASAFGLDEPAPAGAPLASPFGGTTMLATLVGVGILGAGWAWRSLSV
jgi:hypothetical protein